MSVLIRGMAMPSSCSACPLCYDLMECSASDIMFFNNMKEQSFDFCTERHPDCPLIEAKEVDDLREYIQQNMSDLVRDCRTCGCFDPTDAYCGKYHRGAKTACNLCLFAKPYEAEEDE